MHRIKARSIYAVHVSSEKHFIVKCLFKPDNNMQNLRFDIADSNRSENTGGSNARSPDRFGRSIECGEGRCRGGNGEDSKRELHGS